MSVSITPEVVEAFNAHMNTAIDWDMLGAPITRSEANWPADIATFAAGFQAGVKKRDAEQRAASQMNKDDA